jgi:hypothetical protein
VTLHADDGRENNLDALDVLGDIRLKLVRQVSEGTQIDDWASYVARVAYNTCNDYLRAKYPQRTRLKNALRRLLDKSSGYAVWPGEFGELLCGFAGQRNTPPDSTRAIELRNHPQQLPNDVLKPQSLDSVQPSAFLKLIDAVLDYVDGPVALDHMIAIIETVWGIEEAHDEPLMGDSSDDEAPAAPIDKLASTEPAPDSRWQTCERLKLLWGAITELLPHHRAAYLLNLRDGELDSFPYYGVASLEDIGESIALTDQQFLLLADELRLGEDLRIQASILSGSGQKFLIYFKYIPLDDNTIAKALGVNRTQVIAYRNKGIERLRRQLRGSL